MNSFEKSSHLLASESIVPGKFQAVLTTCKQVGPICFGPAHVRFLWIMCLQNKDKMLQRTVYEKKSDSWALTEEKVRTPRTLFPATRRAPIGRSSSGGRIFRVALYSEVTISLIHRKNNYENGPKKEGP